MARTYDQKRRFDITPEPEFSGASEPAELGPLTFVVQRHEASRLHFDFRLECDGALKSWAVPKGPSLNPKVKRMAVMVEDHPLDYANFEGRIPKGQYGGGEVILWDEGTYEPEGATGDRRQDEALVKRGLAEGKLPFVLHGKRLRGGFVLVRQDGTDNWLLIKRNDAEATAEDPTKETTSVRTGLTAEDLRAGRRAPTLTEAIDRTPRAKAAPIEGTPAPMVPVEIGRAFTSELWTFEAKLDGIRALAVKTNGVVQLITRNGNDVAFRFPGLVRDVRDLAESDVILDGEIVLLDEHGRPSFQGLMEAYHQHRTEREPVFFVFDLLQLQGRDVRSASLADRRSLLERVPLHGNLRLLGTIPTDGELVYDQALKLGFEGIVGKRLASPYRSGVRSDDWVKVKGYHTEEFLIGGYTMGFGTREHTFGALLLGRRDQEGKLRFCGSVGGGLSEEQLKELRAKLERLRVPESSFDEPVATRGEPIFVRPELIAEVRFMAWTRDHKLRFPIFKRLRPDLEEAPAMPTTSIPRTLGTTGAEEADSVLEALQSPKKEIQLTVDGHPIRFTSLDKPLWPGLTKRDLIRYLARVSDVYLEYLRDRPLTIVRYPDGIEGEGFFQRHWEGDLPEFVQTVDIYSEHNHRAVRHAMCNNLATLLWLGQMSALELHPWHSSVTPSPDTEGLGAKFDTEEDRDESVLAYPDYLVCDLDPNIRSGHEKPGAEPELNEKGWKRTVQVALELREMLNGLGLRGYVKTTGKTGLHIFIPVKRLYDNDQIREAARTLGKFLMDRHPDEITMETRLDKRPSKVFFDANMNGLSRTLAGAYSPRPVPGGRVSMPLDWDQLEKVHPEDFTIQTVPDLLSRQGDAWAGMLRDRQSLRA